MDVVLQVPATRRVGAVHWPLMVDMYTRRRNTPRAMTESHWCHGGSVRSRGGHGAAADCNFVV